jgi:hypothetical protein
LFPAAEGKKKIKGEGRPASVNREREACGRPCSLWFFSQWEWGAPLLQKKKNRFRVRFSFLYFSDVSKIIPLLKIQCNMVFIGKVLLGFQTSPSTFPFLLFSFFFFVNFDFSYFFVFLKASNINVNSTRKISDHKIYASKVERVPNTFENLNSFEMTLKMLKTMQMY